MLLTSESPKAVPVTLLYIQVIYLLVLLLFSHQSFFFNPVDCRAPLSKRFPREEYWSGMTLPSPGDLPNPGVKPASPALQADSLPLSHQGSPSVAEKGKLRPEFPRIKGSSQ